MKEIFERTYTVAIPRQGATTTECCYAAAKLALDRNEIVEFTFQTDKYCADPKSICDLVWQSIMPTKKERHPFA